MKTNTERYFDYTLQEVRLAFIESLLKMKPTYIFRNAVLAVTWILAVMTFIAAVLDIFLDTFLLNEQLAYSFTISISIWFIIIFANFAESLAEVRGKLHLQTIKEVQEEIYGRLLNTGILLPSSELREGDVIIVNEGELIPCDGEVIDGVAAVDESVITGESAPVIRENSLNKNFVMARTKVLSDSLIIKVLSTRENDFFKKMLNMIDGAQRNISSTERAVNFFLFGLTIIYIFMCVNIIPLASFLGLNVSIIAICSLLVCVMPTTAAALSAPVAISGVEKLFKRNILVVNSKAIDAAGDIDVLMVDKTGTITHGERVAISFSLCENVKFEEFLEASVLSSYADLTSEGKSIMSFLNSKHRYKLDPKIVEDRKFIHFSAHNRISGIDLEKGSYRKGAYDAIAKYLRDNGGKISNSVFKVVRDIGENGGTPLIVVKNLKPMGIIHLKDTIREGMKERVSRLTAMGIRVILTTGDNFYTAQTIANEAGIKEFICEADPERKLDYVKEFQKEGLIVAFSGEGVNDAPSLAQSDIGYTINSSSKICREAANIIDLDNDPMKIIDLIEVGRETLTTRGCLTTFSLASDIAKYFAIIPSIFLPLYPQLKYFDVMNLHSGHTAIASAAIFNSLIIVLCIPIALKGVKYTPIKTTRLVKKFFLIFGVVGLVAPFIGIKLIDNVIKALII